MKQFDSGSIYARLYSNLATLSGWNQIIADGGVTSLLNAIALADAEDVRYIEYLLQEAKWASAQNRNSLVKMGTLVGYKPNRKTSAQGYVVVSTDPSLNLAGTGVTIGTTNQSINILSDLESLLNPYSLSAPPLSIGSSVTFTDGVNTYIPASTAGYTYLPGFRYMLIPVIQGVLRSVNSSPAKGNPFEIVQVTTNQVENAGNAVSEQFLTVSVTPQGGSPVVVEIVDDIYLASSTTLACDIQVSADSSSIQVRFGNGIAGKILPANATVTVGYLETVGSTGNITTNYSLKSVVLPAGWSGATLYCSNIPSDTSTVSGIIGGDDEDTSEDIRIKAPAFYLNNQSVITTLGYKQAIESIPGIKTANVYAGLVTDQSSLTTQTAILYTAITTLGSAPDEVTFPSQVTTYLSGRVSPLDYYSYLAPAFVHTKINVLTTPTSANADRDGLKTTLTNGLIGKFGTLAQSFGSSYSPGDVGAYLGSFTGNNAVNGTHIITEAVTDLYPSDFVPDGGNPGNYYIPFQFDKSFGRLKGFTDDVIHALKINIFFNCVECVNNSRTIYLVKDSSINTAGSMTFTFFTNSLQADNLVITGPSGTQTIAIGVTATPVTIVSAIMAVSSDLLADGITVTQPVANSASVVMTSTTGSISMTYGGTNPVSSTGYNGLKVATQAGSPLNYKAVQVYYDPAISSATHVTNMISGSNVIPSSSNVPLSSILPSTYIQIKTEVDLSTFNPVDITNQTLGFGRISIPQYITNSTGGQETFIGFSSGASDLDSKVRIQVIAQVITSDHPNIVPFAQNNILRIENDSTIIAGLSDASGQGRAMTFNDVNVEFE